MELHGDGAGYNDPAIVTGIESIEVLDLHLHVCPVIFHTLMQFFSILSLENIFLLGLNYVISYAMFLLHNYAII